MLTSTETAYWQLAENWAVSIMSASGHERPFNPVIAECLVSGEQRTFRCQISEAWLRMSAFPDTGRSDGGYQSILRVCFRPKADIE
jgi:hypothetical protein